MTSTIPFRPRAADGRLAAGRPVKVWEGPPSVAMRSLPRQAIGGILINEPARSCITLYWALGTASRCLRCPECGVRRDPRYDYESCAVSFSGKLCEGLQNIDVTTAVALIETATAEGTARVIVK
jgi:hypothetical protein